MREYLYGNTVSYDDITIVDGIGYASSSTFNGLLRIEGDTAEIIDTFPGEHIAKITLHHKQYLYNNKICFIPDHAKRIHIYDLTKRSIRYIDFVDLDGFGDPVRGVDSILIDNKAFIFFEYNNNPILVVDLDKECVLKTIPIEIPQELVGCSNPIFNSPFSVYKNCCYAAVWKNKYIFRFDFTLESCEFLRVDIDIPFRQICVVDDMEFYISTFDVGQVIHLKEIDGTFICDSIHFEDGNTQVEFCNIINAGNDIILVPNDFGNSGYIYRFSQNCITEYIKLPDEYSFSDIYRKAWRSHFSWTIKNGRLMLCPYGANMSISLNLREKTLESKRVVLDDKTLEMVKQKLYKNNFKKNIVRETECGDLEVFLKHLKI